MTSIYDGVRAEGQAYNDGDRPGRLDKDGVEWWACDPYPTWYRWEGKTLIQRGHDAYWQGGLPYAAVPWADAPELPIHAMDPSECYGHDRHSDDCDAIVRVKWSGVGCACGARWFCL